MIYLYGALLIANICSGGIAFIAGDYELLRHSEIVGFLILILITLEILGKEK
jgi:hypothetical protein